MSEFFTAAAPATDSIPLSHGAADNSFVPTNPLVGPLLTDLYQITMSYAYWRAGKTEDDAVFDLFFRKNPFKGEFTVFAGLEEVLRFVSDFHFTDDDIAYLKRALPGNPDPAFFDFLKSLDASRIRVYALPEGTLAFPKVPLLRVEGPLIVGQLLETPLLTLINFASLAATNAARFRLAAGPDARMLEFGLRRAQGPDGGLSASRYCYMGGFDGTSNVLAGKLFGIPIVGTHAHAFVAAFADMDEVAGYSVLGPTGITVNLAERAQFYRDQIRATIGHADTNISELAAFVAYAFAFPADFLALVDTYDTLASGVPNFCAVALALHEAGFAARGVRLDSGDLAYLSRAARAFLALAGERFACPVLADAARCAIVASNDINEATLVSLRDQGHCITAFGVGTHLVTCQAQPALGCVYKLVLLNGQPRMKLSQDEDKINFPGRKAAFRLYNAAGTPLVDLVQPADEEPPREGERVLVRHAFVESKRAYVVPARVRPLYMCVFRDGAADLGSPPPSLTQLRAYVADELASLRPDVKRGLNPTPYKVSVSDTLYKQIHKQWLASAPISELL